MSLHRWQRNIMLHIPQFWTYILLFVISIIIKIIIMACNILHINWFHTTLWNNFHLYRWLGKILILSRKHNIQIHLYADDTQLYTTFDPNNSADAMKRMEACIAEIKAWMANNLLKLNDSKTEFIIFGTAQDIAKISQQSVTVGSAKVLPSKVVRDIGAMLDTSLTMKTHINSTTRSCYSQLRGISKIRKYLSQDSTKSLIHAYVTSRLDNMNSLLYNIPDYLINKLQILQNNAARLITRQKKYCHITPFLIRIALAANQISHRI